VLFQDFRIQITVDRVLRIVYARTTSLQWLPNSQTIDGGDVMKGKLDVDDQAPLGKTD
jgi:hypothetical protein